MKRVHSKSFLGRHLLGSLGGPIVALLILGSCGGQSTTEEVSDVKIVGGDRVASTDAVVKSTVALLSPQGREFCTGSLISNTHVMTASHCLDGLPWSRIYVFFGTAARAGSIPSSRLRYAVRARMNENFNRAAMEQEEATSPPNDIAILTLNAAAPAGFAPAVMLSASDALTVGEPLILAGFGLTRYDGQTTGTLYKVTTKLTAISTVAKELHFGGRPGHSACMGDSGGPAYVMRNNKLALVGVTSRGSSICDEKGIYTDSRQFRGWLSTQQAAAP